ncbi:MAG: hypothetical protein LAO19_12105 [Acidobacteriia bacterium]|nr:hypothetical protein [Terriglobia bacterium]
MGNISLGRILIFAALLGLSGCNKPADVGTSSSSAGDSPSASAGGDSAPGQSSSRGEENKSSGGLGSLFTAKPIVVDAGTEITVTADQSVSSKANNAGDRFDASLAAPVVVGEKHVIPSGARASGTVTDAKSAGKFKGNAELTVTLTSITVNGQEYDVKTNTVSRASKGRGKRTAVGAGGGAAVGAIIGAIAGGGKGAAIGAGAGAGAGTAGAAFTGERDVTIPAETKLSFRLKEPLEIKAK